MELPKRGFAVQWTASENCINTLIVKSTRKMWRKFRGNIN